ncbi:sporulation membrane protein YtrI [Halalkalibacillus halophilus]|uniref:sporulation membrane protein YtrI n=1 Tax=Halalkalibacillus halophilus TaxID=392827 RepID=UPI0003F590B1|nr:sporulation membrane protein YtrI [Halalkalibacillus halophilus]
MHLPPLHKKKNWQRVFIGFIFGVMCGYMIFLYMYGVHTERWIESNLEVREQLHKVEQENELLKRDQDDFNKESEEKLTIQSIEVEWLNEEDLGLDRFTTRALEESIHQELNSIMGQNIASVSEQRLILIRAIENKLYTVRDLNYTLTIDHITIAPTLILSINIAVDSSAT